MWPVDCRCGGEHCETDLVSQTNVMGVVLNKCRYMGAEYGYGYYNAYSVPPLT